MPGGFTTEIINLMLSVRTLRSSVSPPRLSQFQQVSICRPPPLTPSKESAGGSIKESAMQVWIYYCRKSLLVWAVFCLTVSVAIGVQDPLNADANSWFVVAKGKLAEVAVERALYESAPADPFLIHMRVTNLTDRQLGIDLRDRWSAIYPNLWGYQPRRERGNIDEIRIIHKSLTNKEKAQLKGAFAAGKLTSIPAKQSVDYFQIFNSSSAQDVKNEAQDKYLMISLGGEQLITDGKTVEQLSLERKYGPKPGPDQTSLTIPTPVPWKALPAEARVIGKMLFPRKAPKER
jgi:hypothetical protein